MTRSRRYLRRFASVAIVGAAAAIAWAGNGMNGSDVIAVPTVLVLESMIPTGRTGTVTLKNTGDTNVTISSFVSSGCGATNATPPGGFPFTIPPAGMIPDDDLPVVDAARDA